MLSNLLIQRLQSGVNALGMRRSRPLLQLLLESGQRPPPVVLYSTTGVSHQHRSAFTCFCQTHLSREPLGRGFCEQLCVC